MLVVVCCSLFVVCGLLDVTACAVFVVRCLLMSWFVVCCLLFVSGSFVRLFCLLCVACCLSCVVRCVLFGC